MNRAATPGAGHAGFFGFKSAGMDVIVGQDGILHRHARSEWRRHPASLTIRAGVRIDYGNSPATASAHSGVAMKAID
jgi:hypothetical protein